MDNGFRSRATLEQAVGDLTGNEDLTTEGRADQKASEIKDFMEGRKDKPDDLLDTVKDKITKH